MPVLATVRQREPGRIGEPAGGAVDDLGHRGERLDGARSHSRLEEQAGEVLRPVFRGRGEGRVHAAQEHVGRAHVVMARHLQVRIAQLADDPIGVVRERHLRVARGRRAAIGEIDDRSDRFSLDGSVRFLDEALHRFREPVVPARGHGARPHALLHHRPFAIAGDEEAVVVDAEAVLNRR